MKYADILRAKVESLLAERTSALAEIDATLESAATEQRSTLTPDESAEFESRSERVKAITAEVDDLNKQIENLDGLERARQDAPKSINFIPKPDAVDAGDVRSFSPGQARDAAMRIVDETRWLDPDKKSAIERQISGSTLNRDGNEIAKRLLVTESDAYRSAFVKGITGRSDEMTERERSAVSELRAMSLTAAAGGHGVPVLIDPSILITTGTGLTDILSACRIETITTKEWKGVSAGATAWSFDAEAAEVSDDAPTTAQPTVTAHMARGFIPFSIEIGQDYPGLASELGRLLEVGYLDLLASKLTTGSGSGEPRGVFHQLDANTNVEVMTGTAAAFHDVDIDKVWAALPERFRSRSTWFMSVDIENKIRAFGSGTATSRFTVDQSAEGISRLNGKRVVLSDYAPAFVATTGARNLLVVGDFQNYLIAQRAGMQLEYIPHLFGKTAVRPTGERGWFAHTRVGAGVVADNAFRLLINKV